MSGCKLVKISRTGSRQVISQGGSEQSYVPQANREKQRDPSATIQIVDPAGRVVYQR